MPGRSVALLVIIAFATTLISFSTEATGQDSKPTRPSGVWGQWRGPSRDGHVSATPSWPRKLTKENFKRQWRLPLGPSYSGPIVDGDRVFTTETVKKSHETVRALDRKTGKEVWSAQWKGAMSVPFFARRNGSWIRSTPAVDDGAIYVAGMLDVLVCFDAATGKERWRVDFTERFGTKAPPFGFVPSPLVHGDHVYAQAANSFVKLDKKTGETAWRSLEHGSDMMSAGAFSSPMHASIHGRDQMLVQSRTKLHGVDVATGAELWGIPVRTFRGMNILTPQPFGADGVLTSAYGGRGHLFTVTKRMTTATDDMPSQEIFAVAEKWKNRSQGYMTSPVVVDGHAYLYLRSKRFTCFDVTTGEVKWISDPMGDTYWSVVAQKDRLLALTDAGELLLIAANPEKFELVDKIEVSEGETWAHLAVDGDQVFIRELDALSAWTWK